MNSGLLAACEKQSVDQGSQPRFKAGIGKPAARRKRLARLRDRGESRNRDHAKFRHHIAKPRYHAHAAKPPGLEASSATGLFWKAAPKSSAGEGREAQHSMLRSRGVTKPLFSGVAMIIP